MGRTGCGDEHFKQNITVAEKNTARVVPATRVPLGLTTEPDHPGAFHAGHMSRPLCDFPCGRTVDLFLGLRGQDHGSQ